MPNEIYTIGHSNLSFESFATLLCMHKINLVCDVRSTPISRFPQFCQIELKLALEGIGIRYTHAGRSLGARSSDANDYIKGQVKYDRLAAKPLFAKAIKRLSYDATHFRIAIMCAEREPLECHRAILVARHLVSEGVPVLHILANGRLEPHHESMRRLIDLLGLPSLRMMVDPEELLLEAYAEQEARIAYQDRRPTERTNANFWELSS
jgi:uncharacterized protein (DUF488 family)